MISFRKTIAAATIVSGLAAATPASAATYSFDFFGDWAAHSVISNLFTSGALNAILVGAGIPINPTGSSSVDLTDTFTSTGAMAANWVAQLNVRATSAPGGTTFSLLGESLKIPTTAIGVSYSYEAAGPAPTTFAAAPGPIAGAGLPVVLGMMGFAAWRRRKAA